MTEEIKALKTLISVWEKKAKHAEKMLLHLRTALSMMTEPEVPSAAASKKRKAAPPPPFSTKYGKRSEDYIIEALEGQGMSLRQLQEALASTASPTAIRRYFTRSRS